MSPKKKQELSHVGTFINNVLKTCRANRPDVEMTRIWSLWDETIGTTIAENARPAAFKGQVLLVTVTSSPWMQQLQFLKKDIIQKLNTALGKELVSEIKFKIGSL
jgi:predicted nucleic acid-binding Zn ribbon protein